MSNDTLRQCGRCGRIEYAAEAQIDLMTRPDGQPCGGVFTLTKPSVQAQSWDRWVLRPIPDKYRYI